MVGKAGRPRTEWWSLGLQAPAIAFLGAAYGFPLAALLVRSVAQSGFDAYRTVLEDPYQWIVLGKTLRLALEVAISCAIAGFPIAYMMLRSSDRVRAIIAVLVILPMWIGSLVRAYAWLVLLGRNGVANQLLLSSGLIGTPLPLIFNHFAVWLGMMHYMLPLLVFPLYSAMQRIDLRLLNAATSLGAGRAAGFCLVFLPLCVPGITAGCILVFVLSLGFFVTPALLGGTADITYVMLIEQQVNQALNWVTASVMSVILLVTTLVLVFLFLKLFGFAAGFESSRRQVVRDGGRLLRWGAILAGRLRNPFAGGRQHGTASAVAAPPSLSLRTIAWILILFLFLPILILVPLSFSAVSFIQFPPTRWSLTWYVNYFTRADWLNPTLMSFEVAAMTMLVSTVLGTLAAIGLVRGTSPLNRYLRAFFISPMVAPTLVLAVAIYFQLSVLHWVGTRSGLVVAHVVISVPIVIVVVMGALERVNPWLERAARSLGASPVGAFVRITLPQIRAGVISGAAFAFLTSFDDVVMALFISGPTTATLPKRMWDSVHFESDPTLMAASMLMIAMTLGLFFLSKLITLWLEPPKARRTTSPVQRTT